MNFHGTYLLCHSICMRTMLAQTLQDPNEKRSLSKWAEARMDVDETNLSMRF